MDYEFEVGIEGKYTPLLSSDEGRFGGFDRVDMQSEHFSYRRDGGVYLKLYNPSRSVTVYKWER